jgi:hypothetical protein
MKGTRVFLVWPLLLFSKLSTPNVTRVIKSRMLRWAGHVTHTGNMRNACKILVGKSEGRPKYRWEGNIRMDVR